MGGIYGGSGRGRGKVEGGQDGNGWDPGLGRCWADRRTPPWELPSSRRRGMVCTVDTFDNLGIH